MYTYTYTYINVYVHIQKATGKEREAERGQRVRTIRRNDDTRPQTVQTSSSMFRKEPKSCPTQLGQASCSLEYIKTQVPQAFRDTHDCRKIM